MAISSMTSSEKTPRYIFELENVSSRSQNHLFIGERKKFVGKLIMRRLKTTRDFLFCCRCCCCRSRRRCCLFHPSVFVGENPSEPQHPGVCSSSIYFEEAKSLVSLILSSRPTYWPRYVSLKYVFSFFLHLCRLRKKCFEMFSRSKSYFC